MKEKSIYSVDIVSSCKFRSSTIKKKNLSLWGKKSNLIEIVLESQATGKAEQDLSDITSIHVLIYFTSIFSSLESELATVRQEKESLTQQLLNTIKHKVALSQELDAWQVSLGGTGKKNMAQITGFPLFRPEPLIFLQEDMRLVINQQVQQRQEERPKESLREKDASVGLQRSKSLKVKGEGGKGFFSFFRDK